MISSVIKLVEDKVCKKCGVVKAVSEFYRTAKANAHKNDGYSYNCKECDKEYAKSHRGIINPEGRRIRHLRHAEKLKSDPKRLEKVKSRKNKWNRSAKYYDNYYNKRFGISLDEVQKMLSNQNGLCANIGCSKPIRMGSVENNATFAVDHNHETGKVRALLCTRCNCMLGHIEKNRSLVPGMMDYLNKHN